MPEFLKICKVWLNRLNLCTNDWVSILWWSQTYCIEIMWNFSHITEWVLLDEKKFRQWRCSPPVVLTFFYSLICGRIFVINCLKLCSNDRISLCWWVKFALEINLNVLGKRHLQHLWLLYPQLTKFPYNPKWYLKVLIGCTILTNLDIACVIRCVPV